MNKGKENSFEWDPTEPVATRPLYWQHRTSSDNYSLFYTHDGNKNVSEVVFYQRARGVAAHYEYAPFGEVTVQTRGNAWGSLDLSMHNPWRFSSEYEDDVLGVVYYNYRHYSAVLGRWIRRDDKGEESCKNLYFAANPINDIDLLGRDRYISKFALNCGIDHKHVGVAVDTWMCSDGKWVKTGEITFDFGADTSEYWNDLGIFYVTIGRIEEHQGLTLEDYVVIYSTPSQDLGMLRKISEDIVDPPLYSFFFNNCIHWSTKAIDYGLAD